MKIRLVLLVVHRLWNQPVRRGRRLPPPAQLDSARRWFRRFDSRPEHFEIARRGFEVLDQARRRAGSEPETLAPALARGARCTLESDTKSVDERLPFISAEDHHDAVSAWYHRHVRRRTEPWPRDDALSERFESNDERLPRVPIDRAQCHFC
jgi:hypothetical protein